MNQDSIQDKRQFPFTMIDNKLLEDKSLKYYVKLTYIMLCKFANNQHQCFPSRKTIAELADCSVKSVDRAIKELIKRGYIRKVKRKTKKGDYTSNLYEILGVKGSDTETPPPSDSQSPPSDSQSPELDLSNKTNENLNIKDSQDCKNPDTTSNLPQFDKDSKPYKAALKLRQAILSVNDKRPVPKANPADMESWAKELDRLNRLGPVGQINKGYSWAEIETLIEYLPQHDFWSINIRSVDKFRKQICRLDEEMQKDYNFKGNSKAEEKKVMKEYLDKGLIMSEAEKEQLGYKPKESMWDL